LSFPTVTSRDGPVWSQGAGSALCPTASSSIGRSPGRDRCMYSIQNGVPSSSAPGGGQRWRVSRKFGEPYCISSAPRRAATIRPGRAAWIGTFFPDVRCSPPCQRSLRPTGKKPPVSGSAPRTQRVSRASSVRAWSSANWIGEAYMARNDVRENEERENEERENKQKKVGEKRQAP